MGYTAKKIPIEHILASSRGAGARGANAAAGAASANQQGVSLEENASKVKDACSC
jgi:Ras-related protein Rab-5C